jgi:hypothetical protein
MSSIVTTSIDGKEPGSQDSGFSLEDLIQSLVESMEASFATLSEPEQRKLYQQIMSLLPDAQQSKPSAEETHDRFGCFDDAADDDDDPPVFDDQEYQRDLRRRWMSSETPEQRKNLALEGYRVYWKLGDSIALPNKVIKTLGPCGTQVTAKAGWLHYLQMLGWLSKACSRTPRRN